MPAKSRGSLDDEFCPGLPEFAGMGGLGLRVWSLGFRVAGLRVFLSRLKIQGLGLDTRIAQVQARQRTRVWVFFPPAWLLRMQGN